MEAEIDLGGKVCPPLMLKDLLGENKNTYIKMAKLKGKGAQYVMCGCLAKSDSLPLACIDDLQPGDCRSEGYEINLKVLDKAASLCSGILEGEPETLGAAAIAYAHAALGAAQAWLEQLKGRCEAVAANYIRHEAANSLCIEAIAHI